MEVDRVRWRIFRADCGICWHCLILISSYHTLKVHTLSFSTFSLSCSVRDFVDPCNYMDLQRRIIWFLRHWFLCSLNQNRSFLWIPFGCWIGASRESSHHVGVPTEARLTVHRYIKTLTVCIPYYDVANLVTVTKTNTIRPCALLVSMNHCCENMSPYLPQKLCRGFGCSRSISQNCAVVSASL